MNANSFIRSLTYGEYAAQTVPRGKIDLRHNNNPFIGVALRAIIATIPPGQITRYSYTQDPELLNKICKKEKVKSENILITAGADGALHHIAETFLDAETHALIPVPSFPRYEFHVKVVGAQPTFLTTYQMSASGKLLQIQQQNARKHYAVIFLDSPNNPTGEILTRTELENFLSHCTKSIVVLDQALSGYQGNDLTDLVYRYPNLILVKSFSKLYGLAGFRIGYLIAQSEIIDVIKKTTSPFAVSSMALQVAKHIINDTSFLKNTKRELQKSLLSVEKNLPLPHIDHHGPFLLLDGGTIIPHLHETLLDRNILTVPGNSFRGLEKTNTVRISLTNYHSVTQFIAAIQKLNKN